MTPAIPPKKALNSSKTLRASKKRPFFMNFKKLQKMSDLKEAALREEVRAFLENVMARAIFDAKDGKNKMLNLIRAQRNAGAESISAQNYFETPIEVGNGQSIKIRVYNAEPERPKTALIYLHGGGWTIGSAQTCAKVCSDFSKDFTVMYLWS